MEPEGDGDTNSGLCTSYNLQKIGKRTGRLEKRISRDYPDYSIVKIDQNTKKSPGDLRNKNNNKKHQIECGRKKRKKTMI